MTVKEITQLRLLNQQIANSKTTTPYEIVKALGAIQAQDYYSALWAIGVRLPGVLETDIERELDDRKVVRTWPMRGTLHFVPAEDAKWMLQLMTPRVIAKSAGIYRQSELDEKIFDRARDIFVNALQGGKALIREEMYQLLEKENIVIKGQRGIHIIGHLAQNGLICFGKRIGKQQTFVLLDEWVLNSRSLSKEESLAEIGLRYFKSHGPATLDDFAWWTGLLVAEAKEAIQLVKNLLKSEVSNGKTYWMSSSLHEFVDLSKGIFLLPAFDEFLISYSDRSPSLDSSMFNQVFTKNGIFNPIIVHGGKVKGIWKRTLNKDNVVIELKPFEQLSPPINKSLTATAKKFAAFLGKSLEIKNETNRSIETL
jgi:hypothetical protein